MPAVARISLLAAVCRAKFGVNCAVAGSELEEFCLATYFKHLEKRFSLKKGEYLLLLWACCARLQYAAL